MLLQTRILRTLPQSNLVALFQKMHTYTYMSQGFFYSNQKGCNFKQESSWMSDMIWLETVL